MSWTFLCLICVSPMTISGYYLGAYTCSGASINIACPKWCTYQCINVPGIEWIKSFSDGWWCGRVYKDDISKWEYTPHIKWITHNKEKRFKKKCSYSSWSQIVGYTHQVFLNTPTNIASMEDKYLKFQFLLYDSMYCWLMAE